MKVSMLRGALIAGAFLVCASQVTTAFAQRGGGAGGAGFGGGIGGGGSLQTATNPQVQTELNLTDEQKEKLRTLSTESRAAGNGFQGLQDLSAEERQAKMAELRTQTQARTAETNKKVDELLQPEQRVRLKQIVLQLRGTQALSDAETATALGLSDEQKEKIKTIADKLRPQAGAGGRGAGAGGPGGGGARITQEARTAANEEMLAVLSAEQKERFEKMKGKEFKLEVQPRAGRGGGNAKNANPAPEKKDL